MLVVYRSILTSAQLACQQSLFFPFERPSCYVATSTRGWLSNSCSAFLPSVRMTPLFKEIEICHKLKWGIPGYEF